jgi:hypothetical protein
MKQAKNFINTSVFLIPFLIFTLAWIYIFFSSGIIYAGFNYFLDDHSIVSSNQNHTTFYDIFIEPFTSLLSSHTKERFRPLYDVFIRLFSQVYGLNPFNWYLSSLVVANITVGIFYVVGILQGFSYIEAAGFAALIVFGNQASTYTRFGTPETTSTLFIAIAMLFASLNIGNNIINTNSKSYIYMIYCLYCFH